MPADADPPKKPPAGPLPAGSGGRFELVEAIGSGSSSTVYRARLLADYRGVARGDEVAVKFLRDDLLADTQARERLQQEGELGRSLRHPPGSRPSSTT